MESVSPDIAKQLLTRDFTNLVARLQKGGKLTRVRAERAMLESMASGAGASPSPDNRVELRRVGRHPRGEPAVGQRVEEAEERPEAVRERAGRRGGVA